MHDAPLLLTLEPAALERCFLVADIMDEVHGEPLVEYGLLGLAHPSRPFHIVETPLLPGQSVTRSSVFQSGADVLRMRREIGVLAQGRNAPLMPIAFIHRHPHGCRPSHVDNEFLAGVFIDQISTAFTFRESLRGEPEDVMCPKCASSMPTRARRVQRLHETKVDLEYAVGFSLIVNKERQHSLTAARKQFCPACGAGQLRYVLAAMEVSPNRPLTACERGQLRQALELEIESKVDVCQETPRPGSESL